MSNRHYLKNILTLSIGSVVAQIFNLLSQPILTRMLSPDVLGEYVYVVNIANICIPIASLKLDLLIAKEKDEDIAIRITDVCFIVLGFLAIFFFVSVSAFVYFSRYRFKDQFLVPIFVLFMFLTEGSRYITISYCNRYKNYSQIAKLSIFREAFRAIFQIFDSLIFRSFSGQCLSHIIAPLFGQIKPIKEYLGKRRKPSVKNIIEVLKLGKKQLLYIAPSQFLNTFAYSMIAFTIADLFSTENLAYYSISIKVLGLPMMYITASVSKVVYKDIADRLNSKEKTYSFLLKNIASLFLMSLFIFSVLFYIAPSSCQYIFGESYYVAGVYMKTLAVMYAMRFISTSFAGLFTLYDIQGAELVFNLSLFMASLVCYIVTKNLSLNIIEYLNIVNISAGVIYASQVISYCYVAYSNDKKCEVLK